MGSVWVSWVTLKVAVLRTFFAEHLFLPASATCQESEASARSAPASVRRLLALAIALAGGVVVGLCRCLTRSLGLQALQRWWYPRTPRQLDCPTTCDDYRCRRSKSAMSDAQVIQQTTRSQHPRLNTGIGKEHHSNAKSLVTFTSAPAVPPFGLEERLSGCIVLNHRRPLTGHGHVHVALLRLVRYNLSIFIQPSGRGRVCLCSGARNPRRSRRRAVYAPPSLRLQGHNLPSRIEGSPTSSP